MSTAMPESRPTNLLSAPETRRFLNEFVRKRVNESHVDDIVQTVLVNALEAPQIPGTESELRRWLTGIAKHKIADLHRKAGREQPAELPDIETAPPPVEERLMAEWAESQIKQSKDKQTLQWMAREGEGEKLEQIAAEEKVEAATVRQRVSRMRRWMKERWIAELAAVAALAVLGILVYRWLSTKPVEIVHETPSAEPISPHSHAMELRKMALERCADHAYDECLRGLDQAKELDPAGDLAPEVQGARAAAKEAIENRPKSAPDSTAVPLLDPSATSVPTASSAAPSATTPFAPPPPSATPFIKPAPPKAPTKPTGDFEKKKAMEQQMMEKSAPPQAPPTSSGATPSSGWTKGGSVKLAPSSD